MRWALVGLAYGIAHLSYASGFLAVFAAGLALRRVREQSHWSVRPLAVADDIDGHDSTTLATHPSHASATMRDSVLGFNEQLEKFAELVLVLIVGAMLAFAKPLPAGLWFVPLVLLVLRPLCILVAMPGEQLKPRRSAR